MPFLPVFHCHAATDAAFFFFFFFFSLLLPPFRCCQLMPDISPPHAAARLLDYAAFIEFLDEASPPPFAAAILIFAVPMLITRYDMPFAAAFDCCFDAFRYGYAAMRATRRAAFRRRCF